MNKQYELNYVLMNDEQVEQFAYNINIEKINNYIMGHQEEYNIWKNLERLKEIIKQGLKNQIKSNIKERINILQCLREEKIK